MGAWHNRLWNRQRFRKAVSPWEPSAVLFPSHKDGGEGRVFKIKYLFIKKGTSPHTTSIKMHSFPGLPCQLPP